MVEGIILTSPALGVKPAHPIVGVSFALVGCACYITMSQRVSDLLLQR